MSVHSILSLAQTLTEAQVGKMSFALGWPSKGNRTCWANPDRNNYHGRPDDPEWNAAADMGLARNHPPGLATAQGAIHWQVTPLGRAVLRVRMLADRLQQVDDPRSAFPLLLERLKAQADQFSHVDEWPALKNAALNHLVFSLPQGAEPKVFAPDDDALREVLYAIAPVGSTWRRTRNNWKPTLKEWIDNPSAVLERGDSRLTVYWRDLLGWDWTRLS